MSLARTWRHLIATDWGLHRAFDANALTAIEQAIAQSESQHGGEIRFAVEGHLNASSLWRGITPRQRAIEVFSHLGVWDTEANNGVLIYLSWADRDVEIVADRGFNDRVSAAEWTDVCHRMEQHFTRNDHARAVVEGIAATGALIARHFPTSDRNELSNRPIVL